MTNLYYFVPWLSEPEVAPTGSLSALIPWLQSAPNPVAAVEVRAKEIIAWQRQGHTLTTGQRKLLDFWFVDCARRNPSAALCEEMLKSASPVDANLHWRR